MTKSSGSLSRRRFLAAGASVGLGALDSPSIARADAPVLNVTGWGGKWGDVMRSDVGPAFETEF
jgi:putative spermidine/putrescine transport system substrate-binding protein